MKDYIYSVQNDQMVSGAWEHCLESNGTNLFATRRWGE